MTRGSGKAAEAKMSILLVDDAPANLLALEAILHDLGANLVKAGSGEEALRRLLREDYALVLMDVRMPGLDGYETARLIRGRERCRDLPIIFVTAHDSPEDVVVQAYKDGAADHLTKPLVPEVLRAKVRRHLDAAAAQRASEERARFTARATGITLFQQDADLRYTWIDNALPGFTPEGVVGQREEEVRHTVEDLPALVRAKRRVLATGRGERVEVTHRLPDGRREHYEVTLEPRRDAAGRVVGLLGAGVNITERKRLEQELRSRAGQLQEADRRKDEFLAMLSHELRNPLAPIRNAVAVLRQPGSAAESAEALEIMDRQLRHLVRLVDDLLDVSRITRGKVRLRPQHIDLADVLAQAVEASRPLLEARRHELTVTWPPRPLPLEADPTRLTQVFTNLLNNAAQFTPAGGRVDLAAAAEGAQAVVRVRDNGVGIPAGLLPRVFELFAQGEQSLDRAAGGLGIGLTLVRTLVEMHGGTVEAHSAGPGHGSEFVVRLPIADCGLRIADLPSNPQSAIRNPQSKRVLVVDDSRDAAESLALLLRLAGYEVDTAHDGPAALEAARAQRPEVVLLDIGLPGLDGYEVARRLRREPALDGVLLVALTGYGQDEDRRRAREAGFDHHLVKPASLETLQELLARRAAGTDSGG